MYCNKCGKEIDDEALICPHCGGEIDLFKKGGGEELARQDELSFLGAIPLDPATVVAADLGKPIVALDTDSAAKTAFLRLAASVTAALSGRETCKAEK